MSPLLDSAGQALPVGIAGCETLVHHQSNKKAAKWLGGTFRINCGRSPGIGAQATGAQIEKHSRIVESLERFCYFSRSVNPRLKSCNMEITGYDNVIFTAVDPRPSLLYAIGLLTERWHGSLLTIILDNPPSSRQSTSVTLVELPESGSQIYAVRDEAMDKFADDHAYALMDDGEGPVSFMYSKRGPLIFELNGVKELAKTVAAMNASDPYDKRLSRGINPPEPYDASLCSPILFEVTIVTPKCPREDSFSAWILRQCRTAC